MESERLELRMGSPKNIIGRLSNYPGIYQVDRDDEPERCQKCLSCIKIQNIHEYSHEATPLLVSAKPPVWDTKCYDRSLITVFMLLLLFGSGIGVYLIVLENEGTIIEEFDFVSREAWGLNSTFLVDVPPLVPPVAKILLLELITNCTDPSDHCMKYSEFKENHKEKMRIFNGRVLYNFYQDKKGRIFEGRGAKAQSDCGQPGGCGDVLTIGMLGERDMMITDRRSRKLQAFLDFAVTEQVLEPCYEILVSHTTARYFDDLALKLAARNKRNPDCKYFHAR